VGIFLEPIIPWQQYSAREVGVAITRMNNFMPRIRRRVDENWERLGTGSRAGTPRTGSRTSVRAESRVDSRTGAREAGARVGATVAGPPNFLDPYPVQLREEFATSPPPTYATVRNVSRPEIQQLLPGTRLSFGKPGAHWNATPRTLPPLLTSSLTSLEDIRHGEVVQHLPMEDRLTSIPQFPILIEPGYTSSRQQHSRRPESIASNSTGAVFCALGIFYVEGRGMRSLLPLLGQLPGSEPPFAQHDSHQHMMADSYDWRSSPLRGERPHASASAAPRVGVRRVHTVPQPSIRSPEAANQTSWLLGDSAGCSREAVSTAFEFYSPRRLSSTGQITAAQSRRHSNREYSPHVRFMEDDEPPPPPPKDPGYRPPTGVHENSRSNIRRPSSTWSLPILPSWRRRKIHELTSEKTSWGNSGNQRGKSRATDLEKLSAGRTLTKKASKILNACAGSLSRSIPRLGSSS
jgi:hypothetical protein